jgi:putative spermidine/putrescine transport system ATP-binding protein
MAVGSQPFLELRDLQHSYGKTEVLRGVSIDVREGEFLTLLGPSGSGKSTTLNLVAGFEFPDAGSIRLAGVDVTRLPAHLRDVGMVFQSYALFPHMTVTGNVAFPLQVRGHQRGEAARRVADALRLVRMEAFAERYPQQLSGGQAQRVSIARAIVYGPRLVLMDEPLGALDRKLRGEMQFELKSLQSELGMTLLYVTHDQEEALAMSDRIAVLDGGALAQCAPPHEIYTRPATPFVASFVGDTNLVEARAQRRHGGWVADCEPLGLEIPLPRDENWADGQLLTISIRPEHIRLRPSPETAAAARIEGVQFLGDSIRYKLRRNGIEIAAKATAASATDWLKQGTHVALEVDSERVHVFPRVDPLPEHRSHGRQSGLHRN